LHIVESGELEALMWDIHWSTF